MAAQSKIQQIICNDVKMFQSLTTHLPPLSIFHLFPPQKSTSGQTRPVFVCVLLISSWLVKRLVMVFKKKKYPVTFQALSGNVALKYTFEMQCRIQTERQRGRVGTGITTAGLICKLYAKSQAAKKEKKKTTTLVTVKKGLRATSSGSRQETTCFLSNERDQSWISVC